MNDVKNEIQDDFKYKLKIRNKELNVRKWKVKDRIAFKKLLSSAENLAEYDIADVLVFPCIKEQNILLTSEELKWVSTSIRKLSIGETFEFKYICLNENCKNAQATTLTIDSVNIPVYEDWKHIENAKINVKFGEQVKPQFYKDVITKIEKSSDDVFKQFNLELSDLAMHIIEIDDISTMSFNDMLEYLQNLDDDVFEEIVKEYNKQRFTVKNTRSVICEHCQHEQWYVFDAIEDFFPKSWLK